MSGNKKQSNIVDSPFKSIAELQSFILWAKDAGVKSFKHGDLGFEISDIAIAQNIANEVSVSQYEPTNKPQQTEERDTKANLLDSEPEEPDNDDELLFHSTF